jgi:hypothetical protein
MLQCRRSSVSENICSGCLLRYKAVLNLPCVDAMTIQARAAPAASYREADGETDVEADVTELAVVPKEAGKRYSEVLLALSQLATAGFITALPQVHAAVALHCNICLRTEVVLCFDCVILQLYAVIIRT